MLFQPFKWACSIVSIVQLPVKIWTLIQHIIEDWVHLFNPILILIVVNSMKFTPINTWYVEQVIIKQPKQSVWKL